MQFMFFLKRNNTSKWQATHLHKRETQVVTNEEANQFIHLNSEHVISDRKKTEPVLITTTNIEGNKRSRERIDFNYKQTRRAEKTSERTE